MFFDKDYIDPEEKYNKIKEKAEIQEICNSTEEYVFGKKTKEIEYAICMSCSGHLECIPQSQTLYRCSNCGCVYESVGTLNNRILWVCVYDPDN